ncbi:hypothetical protein ABK040_016305 [Willaertia magna]
MSTTTNNNNSEENNKLSQTNNYYDLFQLQPTCTFEEIKKQYIYLANKYHPDKNKIKDTTNLFILIQEAYEILRDEQKRKVYNKELFQQLMKLEKKQFGDISEFIKLSEMNELNTTIDNELNNEEDNKLSYPCRCGGSYELTLEQLSMYGDMKKINLNCNTCSLLIQVENDLIEEE